MYKNKYQIITLNKKNIDDFAKERNDLLKKAVRDWVFFLDSDEKMSVGLESEIDKVIRESSYDGFRVRRRNFFLGKFIGEDKLVRLGKSKSGIWKRRVHEEWQIKGRIGELQNPLIHETAKTLKNYIAKINKYSMLHAEANMREGKKASPTKIIIYPPMQFLISLISGRGLVFSILQAFHSFLAWGNLWLLKS